MQIEMLDLAALQLLPRNPKDHDIGAIATSMETFGVFAPAILNQTTGHIIGGNGRVETWRALKASGSPPPANVVEDRGTWYVPVVVANVPADQEEAAALALNRTQDLGGYDEKKLVTILSNLSAADLIGGTGYDGDDLDRLLRVARPVEGDKPTPLPTPTLIGDGRMSVRLIILLDDADARARFWAHTGFTPADMSGVTYHWRELR